MTLLVRIDEGRPAWYPVSIEKLSSLLEKVVRGSRGYGHSYALRKNLAYSLQHLEFIDRSLRDLKLSSVLVTQTWKTFIVVGSSVIESLLHYLLVVRNLHTTSDWRLKAILPGNPKTVDGKRVRADSHLYEQLPSAVPVEMSFDAMLKKAEAKKVLGANHGVYEALKRLRPLRNRVHLQLIGEPTDTDWNAFQVNDFNTMAQVLHEVFTSSIFRPSQAELAYFSYLEHYVAE